jgi:hypothetical protein
VIPLPVALYAAVAVFFAAEDPSGGWLDYLERGGLLGMATVAIFAFFTERVVPGTVYRRRIQEEREEKAAWRAIAEGAVARIERAVETAAAASRSV